MADSVTKIIISAKDETLNAFNSVKGNLRLIGGLAAGLGAGAFAATVKQAADFADEMGKAAQKVGVTTQELSELKYAADLSDVSFETLQGGLRKLSSSMFDAANGAKASKDAFKLAGVEYLDASGKLRPVQDVIGDIADRFADLEDGTAKTALAVDLLGKSGAELIPMLNGGSAGLAEMADEAERLGLVIDEQAARAAEEFNDNITRLESSFKGFKINASQNVIPALAQITDAMAEAAKEGGLLEALFVGLGGVAANVIGIDDISQAKDRLQEINTEITDINGKLLAGTKRSDKGIVGLNEKDIASMTQRLKSLGIEAENIKKSLNPAAAKSGGGSASREVTFAEDPESVKAAEKVYDQKLAAFRNYNEELARTIAKFRDATLNKEDPSQALQRELDSYRALNPALTEYLQNQVNIVKQKELQASQDALNSSFDQRELDQLEKQSEAEQAALEDRAATASQIYDELLREQEDLNASLIKNDKERAEEQLRIELERGIARIETLGLENDQAELLINQLNENIKLKLKDATDSSKTGFDDLQRSIEGFGKGSAEVMTDLAFGVEGDIKSMVESSLKELARLSIYKGFTQPLFDAASTFITSGDWFSGLGFANGGRPPLGKASLVGERGPELFVPDQPGTIIPNDFGGGGTNITVHVDARGNDNASGPNAKQIGDAVAAAVRAEMVNQRRNRGLLTV